VALLTRCCCCCCARLVSVQDLSVQHRQANRAHARSVMLGQSGTAAAAMAAAMAAAASVRLEHM
jgi:hypothetical protein